jgi:hypothetical protein
MEGIGHIIKKGGVLDIVVARMRHSELSVQSIAYDIIVQKLLTLVFQ